MRKHQERDGNKPSVPLLIEGSITTPALARSPVNEIKSALLLSAAQARIEQKEQLVASRICSAQRLFSAGADQKLVATRLTSEEGTEAMMATARLLRAVYDRPAAFR